MLAQIAPERLDVCTACTCTNSQALQGWRRWVSGLIRLWVESGQRHGPPFGDYADVAVCAVGFATKTLKRYGKNKRFQLKGCTSLLSMLRKLKCRCTVAHDDCQGSVVKQTAFYSKTLAYHLVIGARCT